MLGFWRDFKYRTEVIVQIHAILMFVPELKKLINMLPGLSRTTKEAKKANSTEAETAAALSLVIIEQFIDHVPQDTRQLTLQWLNEYSDNSFFQFALWGKALKENSPEYPKGMPNLTLAIGHAFWYVGNLARDNKLPDTTYKIFIVDVANMLQGASEDKRRGDRLRVVLD
jgi:hypothetical protein